VPRSKLVILNQPSTPIRERERRSRAKSILLHLREQERRRRKHRTSCLLFSALGELISQKERGQASFLDGRKG